MKKTLIVIAAALLLSLAGCHYSKIEVIQTQPTSVQQQPLGAFNDETYVWESWWFGTNRVHKLDELD